MKLKSRSLPKNKKGFSLVELMVVVAIIGILAVIGIPQYQKFMAKARQAEAKTHLNAIFQGEASFFTEYNTYTGNLSVIGAGAVGQALRYNAGFDNTTNSGGCANPVANSPNGTTANNDMWLIPNPTMRPGVWQKSQNMPDLHSRITGFGRLAKLLARSALSRYVLARRPKSAIRDADPQRDRTRQPHQKPT